MLLKFLKLQFKNQRKLPTLILTIAVISKMTNYLINFSNKIIYKKASLNNNNNYFKLRNNNNNHHHHNYCYRHLIKSYNKHFNNNKKNKRSIYNNNSKYNQIYQLLN